MVRPPKLVPRDFVVTGMFGHLEELSKPSEFNDGDPVGYVTELGARTDGRPEMLVDAARQHARMGWIRAVAYSRGSGLKPIGRMLEPAIAPRAWETWTSGTRWMPAAGWATLETLLDPSLIVPPDVLARELDAVMQPPATRVGALSRPLPRVGGRRSVYITGPAPRPRQPARLAPKTLAHLRPLVLDAIRPVSKDIQRHFAASGQARSAALPPCSVTVGRASGVPELAGIEVYLSGAHRAAHVLVPANWVATIHDRGWSVLDGRLVLAVRTTDQAGRPTRVIAVAWIVSRRADRYDIDGHPLPRPEHGRFRAVPFDVTWNGPNPILAPDVGPAVITVR